LLPPAPIPAAVAPMYLLAEASNSFAENELQMRGLDKRKSSKTMIARTPGHRICKSGKLADLFEQRPERSELVVSVE